MTTNTHSLTSLIPTIRAVIFDMDGVLIDSENQHFSAHVAAIEHFGGKLTKERYITLGLSRDHQLFYGDIWPQKRGDREFFDRVHRYKQEIFEDLQRREGTGPVLAALALVRSLHNKGVPLAVGTALHRNEAERNIEALGIAKYLRVVVTGDDPGIAKKPAPDIYIQASQLLAVPPGNCLVIEDAGNGVKAAVAAGCPCVAVPNEFTRTHDFDGAIVSSFEDIQKAFGV